MARKTSIRAKKSPIPTIIGAGITEQWYFTHLHRLKDYRVKIRPRYFGTETAKGLAKRIEEVLHDGGFAICVFDADVSIWNEAERLKLNALRRKYKDNPSVLLCDSLPSIEYWFLLHYKNTNRYYGTSQAAIEDLKDFIPQYDKAEKFLQQEKWVEEMAGEGRLEEACARAKAFGTDGESYTNVNKVIDVLNNNLKE
jgi:hypothetical protein